MASTANLRKAAFAEESAEVEVLFANMQKLQGLTKKIQGSLNRLDSCGKNVADAISPIYGNTQRLHVTNSNVDRILEVLDRIREPLDQRGQEEGVIRSDPRKVGISDYIASMQRATRALIDLRSSNLKSNQHAINELADLLRFGGRQLDSVFREVLQEDAKPLEPLHYLTKNLDFPTIPAEKLPGLHEINARVTASYLQLPSTGPLEIPTHKTFAEIRGEYLTNTLKNLAMASLSTARKTTADAPYRRGTNGFGLYAKAFADMIEPEWLAISTVFEPQDSAQVCRLTCQSSLREISRTLKELETHIQTNILTDHLLAFELIDIVEGLTSKLRSVIPVLVEPIDQAAKPIREVAKISLPRLVDEARNRVQTLATLPADGAASPITLDVINRLQGLTEYLNPVCITLQATGSGGWGNAGQSSSSISSGSAAFASYAADYLEMLLTNLDGKARVLMKSNSLQGVFMANNVAVIERVTRSSELGSLLEGSASKLEQWRKKSSARYLDAWREPSAQLLDVQYTSRTQRPPSGGPNLDSSAVVKMLGSKERDAIKEKFRNFNTSFDDLAAKHRSYKMEREVRTQLTKDVQAMIEPLYGRFWDRYHDVDKGKGKYVKYDKSQLAAALASMN